MEKNYLRTQIGRGFPKTLELGTIGYQRDIAETLEKHVHGLYSKILFQYNLVRRFKERICWPEG